VWVRRNYRHRHDEAAFGWDVGRGEQGLVQRVGDELDGVLEGVHDRHHDHRNCKSMVGRRLGAKVDLDDGALQLGVACRVEELRGVRVLRGVREREVEVGGRGPR